MELRRLDPRVIWLWRAQAMSRMFFFWGPICVGLGVLAAQGLDWRVGVLIGASLALMLLVLSLLWPALTSTASALSCGSTTCSCSAACSSAAARPSPLRRIQHVDTHQGPIERMFGLSTVAVYTAAGMSADGSIPACPRLKPRRSATSWPGAGETMASNRAPPDDADDERTEVLRGGLLEELEFERTEHLREGHDEGHDEGHHERHSEGHLESSGLFSLDTPTEERPRQPAGPHPDDETVMSPVAPRARPVNIAPAAAAALDLAEPNTPPAAAAPATDTPWRGLHPASLLVNLIPRTLGILFGYWPLLLAWLFGRGAVAPRPEDALFLMFILVPGVLSTLVHLFTLRYRVSGGRLEIRQGLLNRQARTLAPDRIQNVSLVRNLFHRASGLVEVRIETAGDSSTEGMLSALSVEDAEALLTELNAARGQAAAAAAIDSNAPPPPPILRLGAPELLAYGFSAGGLGLAILLMAVGSEVLTVTRPDEVNDLARAASPPASWASACSPSPPRGPSPPCAPSSVITASPSPASPRPRARAYAPSRACSPAVRSASA
ncbi:MAG: PH domain-containing protein [Deltaproteobacteria bacterium]|nr:PH domain-containing protein [Deltaproteobacteria bacterium]